MKLLDGLFILSMALQGCSSGDTAPPISERESNAILDAGRRHYQTVPIGGGWKPDDFRVERGKLVIKVLIPHAAGIMQNDSERQLRAVAVACPGKLEPIWSSQGLRDIEIQGATPAGDIFIDVSCKTWGL